MNEERFEKLPNRQIRDLPQQGFPAGNECVNGLHAIEHGERNGFTFRRLRGKHVQIAAFLMPPYTLELEGSSPTT